MPTPALDLAYVDCPSCEKYGTQPMPAAGAEQLAARHDDLLHRGKPTAVTRAATTPAGARRG